MIRSLFSLFALLCAASAQQLDVPGADVAGQLFSNFTGALRSVECTDETRADNQCNVAPFSGVFVCRKFGSIFGGTIEHTVCSRNIVEGFTLGLQEDKCGCCEPGCNEVCTCACGEGKVEVDVHILGFVKFSRCMTNGWASHATAWGNAAKCSTACQGE